ncbi:unnamed protein product [Medioppia subpectinata]|uniref:Protein kinase domain-containing protein n=1 Tax=Medioppia subpectinata TaxID=1979941 RepID=A0A7R9L1R3_9ACAR|nr:unnamed protein product [Medioppia subpectinata]CAG2112699.1 unnamed protein product [Medioppia subpectinata]
MQLLQNKFTKTFYEECFEEIELIGKGGFGEVYKVRDIVEQEVCAVKIVKFLENIDDSKRQEIIREVQNLANLRSEYIVNYRNSWLENNQMYIEMDFYTQNLQTIIDNKHLVFGRQTGEPMKVFEYFLCCEIFTELLESVRYLHELCPPVIHRDLKPANVLISLNSNNNRFIKICDFGSATYHNMSSMSHSRNVGTSRYMAPEFIYTKYNIKVDIYSLGVIAFDLFNLFDIRVHYYGSLGLGHNRAVNTPHIIPQLCQQNIQQFICGADFVLSINNKNSIHGWGRNGLAHCGYCHSLVVTGDDCVYGWGYNRDGQLGCGEQNATKLITPMQIHFIDNEIEYKIRGVYCYANSSFAVTTDGRVFGWGRNDCNLGHNISDNIKII